MSDPDHERPHVRRLTCPDCTAGPGPENTSVRTGCPDGMTEVWHTADCPELAVQCILTEDRMRRAREADAQSAFSVGVQRLHAAVIDFDTDPAAAPFISALLKLVGAQARSLDRPVPLSRWAEILDECFPDG